MGIMSAHGGARDGKRWLIGMVALLVLIAGLAAASPTASAADDKCKAKDTNHDGDYDEGETQECGGESTGIGGHNGEHMPPPDDSDHNSHNWAGHWTNPQNQERKIIIRNSLTGGWTSVLPNVRADWGDSGKFTFTTQQAATDSTARLNCNMPTNYGRVRVCNHGSYSFSGAGKASVVVNSAGHIQRGRVRVKETDCCKRPLLCQEMGHTLGLDHRPTTASCMHQNAGAAANDPDGHDYEQLGDQTHHHGGEGLTGGVNSDLDVGGGFQDGCSSFTCFTSESSGVHEDGTRVITITYYFNPLAYILQPQMML